MNAIKEISRTNEENTANILIMEDDTNVAKGLEMILTEEGYNVDLQATGCGAMDAMGQHDYNLLMADLRLPDINGMEVIKQVKETKPATEIIVMTGYATSALAVDAMKLGAHDFLAKPFTEDQIKSAINEALKVNLSKMEKEALKRFDTKTDISIQKREVLKILNRTSEDQWFSNTLMEKGSSALQEYTLSPIAKAAIASGDLRWINENIGELTQKQLMFIYKRLAKEAW
ncbi:MAG: response regulator [Thermodesulfobacteriota bacterium]|nr:response regulator [Thermodesulfobacteriota bacterium]